MAVARKPTKAKSSKTETSQPNEKNVMALIEKGGSVATDGEEKKAKREIVQVFFRAPADIIEQVETAMTARAIPGTRQNWLLEAILEKLKREANS